MVSIKQVCGDVVKPASVWSRTMAAAALGRAANNLVASMCFHINPLFTSIGMIVGRVVAGIGLPRQSRGHCTRTA